MIQRVRGIALLIGIAVFLTGFMVSPQAGSVRVIVDPQSPPPIQFGAEELQKTAAMLGGRDLTVYLAEKKSAKNPIFASMSAPPGEESFTIAVKDGGTVAILGGGAAGAMYGALETAENWKLGSGTDLIARTRQVAREPFLAVRGVNMYLTAQGFDDQKSWFWSDDFWSKFLDIMARSRLNFLDLHATYDLTVTNVNTLPFLIKVADYPQVGGSAEKAARNLHRLREIIRLCAARGIKVGLMNYALAAHLGDWNTGIFWKSERLETRPVSFLPDNRLEDYTTKAVTALLRALPGLWIFGFRIGESGHAEDFYKSTYAEALKSASPDLNVYTRTWMATPGGVRELAGAVKQRFIVEIKYNGEHLGLPYQAVTGGRLYPPSGSYQNYTSLPRKMDIVWQIRAAGTHRLFQWGDPDFVRRTVRSCKFGEGLGFSIEPMNAYNPQTDYTHNGNPQYKFDGWVVERQWYWHMLWGRLGYDPETADSIWESEFKQHFGSQAGLQALAALRAGSKIVPFILSYHCQGLDHQDMAAEMEVGNHSLNVRPVLWTGRRLVPFAGDIDSFLAVGTLDPTVMDDPVEYVSSYLEDRPGGRMTPYEAADHLDQAAESASAGLRRMEGAQSNKELACLKLDLEALAALGRYYAARIRSATDLQFYYRTLYRPMLQSAYDHLRSAAAHWDALTSVAEEHYAYVPDLIRMRTYRVSWREEGRTLGIDFRRLDDLENSYSFSDSRKTRVSLGHLPPRQALPGQSLILEVSFNNPAKEAEVFIHYRTAPESGFASLKLSPAGGVKGGLKVEIPGTDVKTGLFEYYFAADGGFGGPYGSTLESRGLFRVHVTADRTGPEIRFREPGGRFPAGLHRIRATVIDQSGIARVHLRYKPVPADSPWQTIEMKRILGDEFEASVPLTPEGILYFFEAADNAGNATRFPNFLERTPYYVIPSWDQTKNQQGISPAK